MLLLATLTLGLFAAAVPAIASQDVETVLLDPTENTSYPLPNLGNVQSHDPSIVIYNSDFYLFHGGFGIEVYQASDLSGPWTSIGTVFDGQASIIGSVIINPTHETAPTVIEHNDAFYCYYCLTQPGTRNSVIGVTTSATLEQGSWTDHGALFYTGTGPGSNEYPFTITNAIDPAVIVDETGNPWIAYGSYWADIWLIPLAADFLAIGGPSTASQLAYMTIPGQNNTLPTSLPADTDPQGQRPEEGSYMNYHAPYYYLWYSRGQCCDFDPSNLPPPGAEYSIRVGRSSTITGPFVDSDGIDLLQGGGQVVYGTNHGYEVYAPGGIGVLTLDGNDILYFHYGKSLPHAIWPSASLIMKI
jgi:arabinan endo-1,5-alpha-L-arabinosidase